MTSTSSTVLSLVVMTISKPTKESRFLMYMAKRDSEKPHLTWPVIEALPFYNVKGATILEEDSKIIISTETQFEEPEVMIVAIRNEGERLEPIRTIFIPDFKTVDSFQFLSNAKLLFLGCTKTLVIFREKGTKYEVIKIIPNVFQTSIDFMLFTTDMRLLTGSYQEGLNITDVRIRAVRDDASRFSDGFKVVGSGS